jgi:hypothetical protein
LVVQAVDRPDAVTGQVTAPGHQHTQLGDQLVIRTQHGQVAAHPGLISDHVSVLRVGLPAPR